MLSLVTSFALVIGISGSLLELPLIADLHSTKSNASQYLPIEAEWCLPIGECILLEVADTQREKKLGLMNRSNLPIGQGMWFQFANARIVNFWMHQTLIPLDMIFLNKGFVVYLQPKVEVCLKQPCPIYGPNYPVDGVIEIAAGEIDRLQIKIGDLVSIQQKKVLTNDNHLY